MSRTPQSLLTTKALVLLVVYITPAVSFAEIAKRLKISEKTVERSIESLEREGFLQRKPSGRRNVYDVTVSKWITPISAASVGDLLSLLAETATVD